MTTDSPTTALTRFGYTPRQAAFLALVALHGGFFLRRQYVTFRGAADGTRLTDLLKRAVQRHHATLATYCRATKVYHLFAHPLYDALGIGDSRNRRAAPPAAVTFKLMTLDVVLRHRGATFLATETEKVACFTTTCGLSQAVLPATYYKSPRSGRSATTRYFVDKAPICLTAPGPTVSVVYLSIPRPEGTHDSTRRPVTSEAARTPNLGHRPRPVRRSYCRPWARPFCGRRPRIGARVRRPA